LRKGAAIAVIAIICCAAVLGVFAYKHIFPQKTHASSTSGTSVSGSSTTLPSSNASQSSSSSTISAADLSLLLLVNKDHPVPDNYDPTFMAIPISYFISSGKEDQDHFVDTAAPYIVSMIDDAKKDGVKLGIVSGFRTKEYQQGLFQSHVTAAMTKGLTQTEAESSAAESVAEPGYSEHETGLAMDLGYNGSSDLTSSYENTPAFAWLTAHAVDYGFILRYPKDKVSVTQYEYEPWHYRFVGVDNAKKIKSSGLCLEEYLESLGISVK